MKTLKLCSSVLALLVVTTLVGCSTTTKSPDVSDSIRKSLDQAGLKDVEVSQDRDKGVVTLGGHVAAEADKVQAESIAKSNAAGQVVGSDVDLRCPRERTPPTLCRPRPDQGDPPLLCCRRDG